MACTATNATATMRPCHVDSHGDVRRPVARSDDTRIVADLSESWRAVGAIEASPKLSRPSYRGHSGRWQCFDRDVAVGVDANMGSDIERAAHDRLGILVGLDECSGGGERIVAARADPHDTGFRL